MKNLKITQTGKDPIWYDESGTAIPYNRINKVERLHEKKSAQLLKEALSISSRLRDFKVLIQDTCAEAYEAFMQSKDVKKSNKGNYTWFNFNRTIKIEVNVSEPIKFDDLTITAAKAKLDEFLTDNIDAKNGFIKEMIIKSFETQRSGQLDVKDVLKLTQFKERVNNPLFSEAIDLITSAIRRPASKTYFRIWMKDGTGEYQNIDLNLSSI
ncbi:DUF3164 family protein [Flavobacterium sp. N1994]|uniref:DUF3164 family protein n=1 Tax=Flavobacterium sp. N1994 TaxID=2986827 RepID=UPI002223D8D4|nr:DUF3164 family protein [Flavobacterium sp. N1994]